MTKARDSSSPAANHILVGPAGWSYADWNGVLYPVPRPKGFHEATYVAQYFDTVEINTSFYQPLRADFARQWLERVSANPRFQFTAKLWRKFTHEAGASGDDEKAVRAGFDVLQNAGKLGAVLLQFPFSFHYTDENFERVRQLLTTFQEYPLSVEVRHSSWMRPDFLGLLRDCNTGFCNIDQPVIGRSVRPSSETTSAVGYFRLHGRRYDTWFSDDPEVPAAERYNYLYSQNELEPWVQRVENVAAHTKTTFVIANNHFEAKAAVNALELIYLLSKEKVKVPETLRHRYPQLDAIADEPAREPTLFPIQPKAPSD